MREHWRAVFDVAINSIEFRVVLDNAEVDALRAAAVELGVDPMGATPREHRHRFCPGHEFVQGRHVERCKHCDVTRREVERWRAAP